MREYIIEYLPWLLSAITIWMSVLMGNLKRNAWLIALANQFLWLIWIVASTKWGFMPLNIALWFVYGRNYWKWRVLP